jgi:hypothetical protein
MDDTEELMDYDWLRHYLHDNRKPPLPNVEWQSDLWDGGETDGDS